MSERFRGTKVLWQKGIGRGCGSKVCRRTIPFVSSAFARFMFTPYFRYPVLERFYVAMLCCCCLCNCFIPKLFYLEMLYLELGYPVMLYLDMIYLWMLYPGNVSPRECFTYKCFTYDCVTQENVCTCRNRSDCVWINKWNVFQNMACHFPLPFAIDSFHTFTVRSKSETNTIDSYALFQDSGLLTRFRFTLRMVIYICVP